jgi:predicted unusual protein kinase regulating ubiquinone biosynthesis (AarF/ABC1/UbiB family)
MESDLFILDKVIKYLYTFGNFSNAIIDIKNKLTEELDYTLEFCNQKHMYDLWYDNPNIKIAELIPDLSNEKLLAMYYIEGETLAQFIDDSTQEERNNIGKCIVEFVFGNLYRESIFYSDVHYGNFLVKDKKILYIIDFGCIHDIDNILLENLKQLHFSILDDDKDNFYNIVTDMGIINSDISSESKEYIYDYFRSQYEPWITDEFEFTEEWLDRVSYKNTDLMKEWELPSNMVYLNKIPYGMYHVLTKLKLKGRFSDFIKDMLK